jgi:hypothetical protein
MAFKNRIRFAHKNLPLLKPARKLLTLLAQYQGDFHAKPYFLGCGSVLSSSNTRT